MKKNKAFTLIELLAVIIILAIIALIATPIIINVIDDAKTQGFKQTALGYYKAAEYIYDEMMMNGKTENVQFTFEDGKQTSSNENYKLEVKGETPQGGLVYLTKEGHIAVSINNNKYCAYVDGNKEVTISEDINNCGYTPVPEECYNLVNRKVDYTYDYNIFSKYQAPWVDINYNMLTYNYQNELCPKEFDMWIIPSEVNGQIVEGIASIDMGGIDISAQHVVIPSSVKIIESAAFTPYTEENTINNFSIPNGVVYIGYLAFSGTHLTEVVIPESVEVVGEYAFSYMPLKSVKIGLGTKIIGNYAFSGNQLHSVTFSEGLELIGEGAFYNNQLTHITIPASVETIGRYTFAENQFPNKAAITIEGDATRFDNNWTAIGFPAK